MAKTSPRKRYSALFETKAEALAWIKANKPLHCGDDLQLNEYERKFIDKTQRARAVLEKDARSFVIEGPTPERFAKGEFARIVPPMEGKTSARKVYRDLRCDAVMTMHAKALIGDNELACAVRFAELAVRAMGPVRLSASGLKDRVDGGGGDDDAQAIRDIQARREWDAVCAALRDNERRVLIEILYHGCTIGQAGMKMFGARWRGANATNAAADTLVQTALEGLVKYWITKGG